MMDSIFSQRANSSQGAGTSSGALGGHSQDAGMRFTFNTSGAPMPSHSAHKRPEISPWRAPPPPQKRPRALGRPPLFAETGPATRPPQGSPARLQSVPLDANSPDTSTGSEGGGGRRLGSGAGPPGPPLPRQEGSAAFHVSGLRANQGRTALRKCTAALSPPSLRNAYASGASLDGSDMDALLRQVSAHQHARTICVCLRRLRLASPWTPEENATVQRAREPDQPPDER